MGRHANQSVQLVVQHTYSAAVRLDQQAVMVYTALRHGTTLQALVLTLQAGGGLYVQLTYCLVE